MITLAIALSLKTLSAIIDSMRLMAKDRKVLFCSTILQTLQSFAETMLLMVVLPESQFVCVPFYTAIVKR